MDHSGERQSQPFLSGYVIMASSHLEPQFPISIKWNKGHTHLVGRVK